MNTSVDFKIPEFKICSPHAVRPTFYMLVGIPGSGKSTIAEKHLLTYDTIHLSSDAIRGELWGDENCQKNPDKVFALMQERTIEALKKGINVIYDATNITRKSRKAILDKIPSYVHKECVIVWAPIKDCISRDENRERTVGVDVINKMLKRFEAPFYDEGFDEIRVDFNASDQYSYTYYTEAIQDLCIPHDNPHHTADVYTHCMLCGEGLANKDLPNVVKTAGYVHDIGKPYTKTFTNMKGETTEVAHYYGHQAVGAWHSYGFGGTGDENVTLAWLISSHMAPFINQKYYNSLDPLYKNWIDAIHTADKEAH